MKNSKHFFLKITAIVLIPIFLSSCVDELFTQRDRTYNGDKLVEFFPDNITVDERAEATAPPDTAASEVNLISPEGLAQSDLAIAFAVDDSSTAVAGQHYNLISSSPLTIAGGTTTTKFKIAITADGLNDGEVRVLYITLRGNDKVRPAENFNTLQVIIRGVSD